MRKLAVAVVVLLLLLVVADRVGVGIAENRVAETLQKSSQLSSEPSVDISGFPFLTQLASKDLDQVTITAKDVPLGTSQVQVRASSVRAVMHGVKIADNLRSVTITHGDAEALVPYAQVSSALSPVTVSYGGGDKVHASVTQDFPVIGRKTLAVDLTPALVGSAFNFGVAAITGVPSIVLSQIEDLVSGYVGRHIPLDRIPFGLRLKGIHADARGIVIDLAGDQVTLHRR